MCKMCPICDTQGETIVHLLRDCPFAQKLWDDIGKFLSMVGSYKNPQESGLGM